jgi:hypothetical protein
MADRHEHKIGNISPSEHQSEANIMTNTHADKIELILRIIFFTFSSLQLPSILRRIQFPIQLAFVISINISQGQTLNVVGIFLIKSVFSHGQLYVTLSWGPDHRKIFIVLPSNSDWITTNIVYRELVI